jgi:hypothetical protein
MTGYWHRCKCEVCGEEWDSSNRPQHELCPKHDDKTKLRCVVCGKETNITPAFIHKCWQWKEVYGTARAAHKRCVVLDA